MIPARTFLCWMLLLLPGILAGVHGQRCKKRFVSCEKKNGSCHVTIEKRCGGVFKEKEVLSWKKAESELSKYPRMKPLSESCDDSTCELKMVPCPWSEWKPDNPTVCARRTRKRCCQPREGQRVKKVCSRVKDEFQERGCPPTTTQTATITHDYRGTTQTSESALDLVGISTTEWSNTTTGLHPSSNLRAIYVTVLISLVCLVCLTGIMGLIYRIYLHVCHKN